MSDLRDDLMATYTSMNESEDQSTDNTSALEANDDQRQEERITDPADNLGQQPSRERDSTGRFTPKTPAKDEVPADQKQGAQEAKSVTEPAPAPLSNKAPVSWKPEEREGFDKMDPRHQAAVIRREREISTTLAQTAEMRTFATTVMRTLTPFMPMIQAAGSNPIQAIGETMKTAAILRTAPPQQRAMAVADLIMEYGIDINILDQALHSRVQGRQMPQDPNSQLMQLLDQRLAPVQQFMNGLQQQRQQQHAQLENSARTTIEEFAADPANEFFEEVREDIGDLMEMAANRGVQMDLQTAYKRATLAHPTISKILERRAQQQSAQQQTAAARRAQNAAVSPSSSGAPSQNGNDEDDGSIRSALSASIRQLSTRR